MSENSVFGRLLSAVAFAAVSAYIMANLGAVFEEGSVRLKAVTLCECTAFEGMALRSEQTVCPERELQIVCTSGKRIAAGGIVAKGENGELRSEKSALYFSDTDGYEYLSLPEEISAETVRTLLEAEKHEEKNSAGRLVSGRSWYIAALTDTDETVGGRCRIQLNGYEKSLKGEILRVSPGKEGTALLIKLKISENEFLSLRRCTGELIHKEATGFVIPESAVLTDGNGKNFVLCQTAEGKEKTEAEILYINGKCLLLPSEHLREGMKIAKKA